MVKLAFLAIKSIERRGMYTESSTTKIVARLVQIRQQILGSEGYAGVCQSQEEIGAVFGFEEEEQ